MDSLMHQMMAGTANEMTFLCLEIYTFWWVLEKLDPFLFSKGWTVCKTVHVCPNYLITVKSFIRLANFASSIESVQSSIAFHIHLFWRFDDMPALVKIILGQLFSLCFPDFFIIYERNISTFLVCRKHAENILTALGTWRIAHLKFVIARQSSKHWQSWALSVFLNFFNNKKLFFSTFYQSLYPISAAVLFKSPLPVKWTW